MAFDICDLLSTCQAIFARILFLVHSLFAVWAAVCVTNKPQIWALTALCGLFIAETVVMIVKRKGREPKW
jgi:Transmembrane protein 26